MNPKDREQNNRLISTVYNLLPHLFLLLISALIYLPFIHQFGYYFDDWYFMYAGGVKGASVFKDIWSIDRPGAAYLMHPLYSIFGQKALYYNLSAYLFRLISAFGLLSIGRMLWPHKKIETFSIALLYLVYPGFLSQPNGIVYQFYVAALAAATWSIALTVKAVTCKKTLKRYVYFAFSIVLGLFYLAQIEWYIGFEAIRWTVVFVILRRENRRLWPTLWDTVRRGWPAFLVPALFLGWRLFFFESERGATDVGLQLGGVLAYPLQTMFRWTTSLVQDMFSVLITAWVSPVTQLGFPLDNENKAIGLVLGLVGIVLWYFGSNWIRSKDKDSSQTEGSNWVEEALIIGVIGLVAGVIPVVIANRAVAFPSYSRYTLVSSLGAVVLLVVGISKLEKKYLREIAISALIVISALTHYGNGFEHVSWAKAYQDFWWQVNWRVPQLERHTTLVANYAIGATEEDYFVWGPANLIYYPDGTNDEHVQPGVYAVLLNQDTVLKTLLQKGQDYNNRRSIRTFQNYRKLLVLTQPTANSCVHVIDGNNPEYSSSENALVRIIGPYSHLEQVLPNGTAPTPPSIVFGEEPEHPWCYFYQKADLARQLGNWDEVKALGNEALKQGLMPNDNVEWLPFLQAYALHGDVEMLNEMAPNIIADPYVAQQACHILLALPDLTQPVIDLIGSQYCLK